MASPLASRVAGPLAVASRIPTVASGIGPSAASAASAKIVIVVVAAVKVIIARVTVVIVLLIVAEAVVVVERRESSALASDALKSQLENAPVMGGSAIAAEIASAIVLVLDTVGQVRQISAKLGGKREIVVKSFFFVSRQSDILETMGKVVTEYLNIYKKSN